MMERKINKMLVLALILSVVFGLAAFLMRDYPHASEAGGVFTFPIAEYLDIDLQRLDISLIPYDGDELKVEYKNDRPLEFEMGDNELIITEDATFVVSLFAGKRSEFGVKIYLPRVDYREISLFTGTGNADVGRISCQKLSAVTETGDITVDGAECMLSLSTGSGRISTDINKIVHDSDIINRSGDTELILPPKSSVAIDFKTKDGECETDLINGDISGSYFYAFNGGRRQINVTAEHGKLVIKERN